MTSQEAVWLPIARTLRPLDVSQEVQRHDVRYRLEKIREAERLAFAAGALLAGNHRPEDAAMPMNGMIEVRSYMPTLPGQYEESTVSLMSPEEASTWKKASLRTAQMWLSYRMTTSTPVSCEVPLSDLQVFGRAWKSVVSCGQSMIREVKQWSRGLFRSGQTQQR